MAGRAHRTVAAGAFAAMLAVASLAQAGERIVPVAAPGNGFARGAIEDALAAARDIRAREPGQTIVLSFAPGTYRVDAPLRLGPPDSGAPDAPLVLRGDPAGATVISGAIVVKDGATGNGVRTFDRDALGLRESPALVPRGFFNDGATARLLLYQGSRRLVPTRWPRNGFAGEARTAEATGPILSLELPLLTADRLTAEPALWLGGYISHDWAYEFAPARMSGHRLTVERPVRAFPARPAPRIALFNLHRELGAEGEFAVDPSAGAVSLVPYADGGALESAVAETLLAADGVAHVRIEALAFEKSLGTAIRIANSFDVTLSRCFVGHTGEDAARITGGRRIAIEDCVIRDTAERGLSLSGGDRQSLAAGGHAVRNSMLLDNAVEGRTYRPAIALNGVGNLIEGNLIARAPHSGIILSGNDHRIEGNELHQLVRETDDAGAIYMGRDWTQRGNVIAGNFIHDIGAREGSNSFVSGIYLDDQFSSVAIRSNVFARVSRGIVLGGGRDNEISGNVFVAPARGAIWMDDRGLNTHRALLPQLMANLEKVDTASRIWKLRYPQLAALLEEAPNEPRGNVIASNLTFGGEEMRFPRPEVAAFARIESTQRLPMPPALAGKPGFQAIAAAARAARPGMDLPQDMPRAQALAGLLYASRAGLTP